MLNTFKAKAKSPRGIANELKKFLVNQYGLNELYVFVWSPEESARKGYGNAWTVCAEGGPFEWAPNLTGNNRNIFDHKSVFAECYNNHIVNFYKKIS